MRETQVGSLGQERAPGGGHGNPLQDSCLENPHGQRSLVGYSPGGHKELVATEQLTLSVSLFLFFLHFQFFKEPVASAKRVSPAC